MKKIITVQKTKLFWIYFIFSFLFVAAFIFLAPFWDRVNVRWKDWGKNIVYIIIAIFLTLYLVFFLFKQVRKKTKAVIYSFTLVEFVLLAVLDVLCIVTQFVHVLDAFFTGSRIFGIALFLRGLVGCFHGYFYNTTDEHKYPLWQFCVDIVLLCLGVFLMSTDFISNNTILWIFVSIILVLGILCFTLGFLTMPQKKKKAKSTTAASSTSLDAPKEEETVKEEPKVEEPLNLNTEEDKKDTKKDKKAKDTKKNKKAKKDKKTGTK